MIVQKTQVTLDNVFNEMRFGGPRFPQQTPIERLTFERSNQHFSHLINAPSVCSGLSQRWSLSCGGMGEKRHLLVSASSSDNACASLPAISRNFVGTVRSIPERLAITLRFVS